MGVQISRGVPILKGGSMVCEACGKDKEDVCERPDGYRQDVLDEPEATWVACDECDQQNNDDI
jgi:hypothetical protein